MTEVVVSVLRALVLMEGQGTAAQVASMMGITHPEAGKRLSSWREAGAVRKKGSRWILVTDREEERAVRREDRKVAKATARAPLTFKFGARFDERLNAMMGTMEKRPCKRGWTEVATPPVVMASRDNTHAVSSWRCGPIFAISELATMEAPDGDGVTPQWLVSITCEGRRPAEWQVRKVLSDFDMEEAEEDNHYPGQARGFFLVVDPARRVDCHCKTTETVVVEPDGYQWSKDTSGRPCVGCEVAATAGMACPQHGPVTTFTVVDTIGVLRNLETISRTVVCSCGLRHEESSSMRDFVIEHSGMGHTVWSEIIEPYPSASQLTVSVGTVDEA